VHVARRVLNGQRPRFRLAAPDAIHPRRPAQQAVAQVKLPTACTGQLLCLCQHGTLALNLLGGPPAYLVLQSGLVAP
jgi:hypothetical protein